MGQKVVRGGTRRCAQMWGNGLVLSFEGVEINSKIKPRSTAWEAKKGGWDGSESQESFDPVALS